MNAIHPPYDPFRLYDPYLEAANRRAQETEGWARRRAMSRSARGTGSGSPGPRPPRDFISRMSTLAHSIEAVMIPSARTRPSTPVAPQHR